jgi:hypothetical protein
MSLAQPKETAVNPLMYGFTDYCRVGCLSRKFSRIYDFFLAPQTFLAKVPNESAPYRKYIPFFINYVDDNSSPLLQS